MALSRWGWIPLIYDHNFRTSKFEMTLMKWATQQLSMHLYVEVLQILVGELTIFVLDMNNLRTSDQWKLFQINSSHWYKWRDSKEMKLSDTNEKIQKKWSYPSISVWKFCKSCTSTSGPYMESLINTGDITQENFWKCCHPQFHKLKRLNMAILGE